MPTATRRALWIVKIGFVSNPDIEAWRQTGSCSTAGRPSGFIFNAGKFQSQCNIIQPVETTTNLPQRSRPRILKPRISHGKIIHMGKVRLPPYTASQECHGMIMLDKR